MIRLPHRVEIAAIARPRRARPESGLSILVNSFFGVVLFFSMAAFGLALIYTWVFPYGRSHCCIQGMWHSLARYSTKHGLFPAGEATPEASLSLLNYEDDSCAGLLRGKTVPHTVVERILNSGGLLGPNTCGWHYVEGLTPEDDRRLAILWDKVGLGHDGEQLFPPGHEVLFVGGDVRIIRKADWPAFLAEQERLHAARRK